ncbi:hypothetical protein V6Z05_19740 [Leptospira venezuelensis]|uniref:hypothetical protein n=1 Tax=Leptospira venezuelensis TaxID=1958811 RepID=UPI000A3CE3AA|nr:hypothetical protein [Leptospira venezuelensis]
MVFTENSSNDHPILNRAFEYRIVGFNFQDNLYDPEESYLTLTLQKDSEIKTLRFNMPVDIYIEKGFPLHTGGLCILDVKDRQLENINVQVADFESTSGGIYFYAKSVELILEG